MLTAMAAVPYSTDRARWLAVSARDRAADGQFVYAVSSTGVYCRPACPSRRPRPDRVRYFPTPDQAEAAGFRACRRCHPRDARSAAEQAVDRARAWIDQHPDHRPTLARLARVTGLSAWHLQRVFTKLVGVSPADYARAMRTSRLKRELRRGSVTDAIYAAGFGSSSRVYEEAPARLGMTPGAYRRGGDGERIYFTTFTSRAGVMLAAATDRGLCRVAIGDAPADLERLLRDEFPAANLKRDPAKMKPLAAALKEAAAGGPLPRELPLDIRATAFQRRVWKALQAIPRGQTRTYAQLAALLGQPRAARAVGHACAANQVALAIPCHRVVPATGGVGGYRWGSERKRRLLEDEARQAG